MSERIFETVITTCSPAGAVHIAPMGVRYVADEVVLKPFRPSRTLDNVLLAPHSIGWTDEMSRGNGGSAVRAI